MSIVRSKKRESPYVQIDKTCLNDNKLSWKAKGLHAYLMSRPDNWTVRISQLSKASKEGRDAMRSGLAELENAGYATKEKTRNEKGIITGTDWVVAELPDTDKPKAAEPTIGQPASTKARDKTKNDKTKGEREPSPPSLPLPPLDGESAPSTGAIDNCEDAPQAPISPSGAPAPAEQRDKGVGAEPQPRKVTWVTPYDDAHIEIMGGPIKNYGLFCKHMKPLHDKYGLDITLKAWRKHLTEEGKFASAAHFASKPLIWIDIPTSTSNFITPNDMDNYYK